MKAPLVVAGPPPVGRGATLWVIALACTVAALSAGFDLVSKGAYLRDSDQFYYATIARSLARHQGCQAEELLGPDVELLRRHGARVTRDLRIPPDMCRLGWPLALAGIFKLLGATDAAYGIANMACLVVIQVVLALLCLRLVGVWAAVSTIFLLACLPFLYSKGFHQGLELQFCALVVVAAVLLMLGKRGVSAVAAALCLALAFFTRSTAVCFFPLGLLSVYGSGDEVRWRRLGAFAVALVVLCGVAQWVDSALRPPPLPGGRFSRAAQALLSDTRTYPGLETCLGQVVPTWGEVLRLKREIAFKALKGLRDVLEDRAMAFPLPLAGLAALGWLSLWRSRRSDWFVTVLGVSGACISLLAALAYGCFDRHLLPVEILVTAFAGAGVVALHREVSARHRGLAFGMVAVVFVSAGLLGAIDLGQKYIVTNTHEAEDLGREIARLVSPGGLVGVCEDRAWIARGAVGWHADCKAIALPAGEAKLAEVLRSVVAPDLVVMQLSPPVYRPRDPASPPSHWVPGYALCKLLTLEVSYIGKVQVGLYLPGRQ